MQSRLPLLYTSLILAIIFATLHFMAMAFYFYWIYWWYDVMMHFMAGIVGGVSTYWVLFHSGFLSKGRFASRLASILSVLLCVMVAGVAWEVFEYVHGITDSHETYQLDTINDLILDGSGAVLATLLSMRRRNNNG